jgi:hypothetical protein
MQENAKNNKPQNYDHPIRVNPKGIETFLDKGWRTSSFLHQKREKENMKFRGNNFNQDF